MPELQWTLKLYGSFIFTMHQCMIDVFEYSCGWLWVKWVCVFMRVEVIGQTWVLFLIFHIVWGRVSHSSLHMAECLVRYFLDMTCLHLPSLSRHAKVMLPYYFKWILGIQIHFLCLSVCLSVYLSLSLSLRKYLRYPSCLWIDLLAKCGSEPTIHLPLQPQY